MLETKTEKPLVRKFETCRDFSPISFFSLDHGEKKSNKVRDGRLGTMSSSWYIRRSKDEVVFDGYL